jgi:PAS domain S-box-containing protein
MASVLEHRSLAARFPLFEASPLSNLIVDADAGVVVAGNAAAARLYGYSQAELRGLPLECIWPRGEAILRDPRTDPLQRTWRHRRKSGEWLHVTVSTQAVALDAGPALVLQVNDLTDRAFSAALMESQGRVLEMVARGRPLNRILAELVRAMERLSAGMLGSVLLLDEAGRLRHGAAPSLPRAYWRAIDGVKIGPAVGSCGTAVHLRRQVIVTDIAADPLWQDYRALALPHGLRACWSTPIFCRAGKVIGAFAMYYREVRSPGERDLRLVHAAVDLAAIALERDLADRELKASEERLRAILDHAASAVYVKDLEGRYRLANRHFERVTGIAAADTLGRRDAELFPREIADALVANDRRVLDARAPLEAEETMRHADGEHVYLSVKFPLLRADGTAYAVCGISSDITAIKLRKRELERSREQLRALTGRLQTVREEERVRISREIHDELGQVLTALRMNQTLLLEGVRAGECDQAGIVAQLESMQAQVKGALASVRRIATELRPDVLDSLGLAAALEWQAAEFTHRTGIACAVALPPAPLEVDAARATALFRICQEALTNAARHSGASRVHLELRSAAAVLELSVADDGRGMALDGEQGVGLSLGILGMRERAAALGGEVAIDSAPGRGTTVTARLPAGRG